MALFKSVNAAVRFALNYANDANVERSAMNKLSDPSKGVDRGLSGVDGMGQAGMIRAMMHTTGEFHEACLIARAAVHRIPCSCGAPCCSRSRPNFEWHEAVNYISLEVKRLLELERKEGIRGIKDDPALRRTLVAKYFGERIRIKELAKACEITEMTVAGHQGKFTKIIKKAEGEAWDLIDEKLRAAEIID